MQGIDKSNPVKKQPREEVADFHFHNPIEAFASFILYPCKYQVHDIFSAVLISLMPLFNLIHLIT